MVFNLKATEPQWGIPRMVCVFVFLSIPLPTLTAFTSIVERSITKETITDINNKVISANNAGLDSFIPRL